MQYTVLTNLNHDQQVYTPGSKIELDNETVVARLIENGAIRDPKAPVEPEQVDLSRRVHMVKNGIEPKVEAPAADAVEPAEASAEDATPSADNKPSVSEDMKRDELEAIALEEGHSQEAIDACANKASLVSLIDAGRNPVDSDPSADL